MLNQFRLFMQMQQSYEASAPASTATSLTPHVSGPAQPTTALIPTAQCNALNSVTPNQPPITGSQPAGRNPPITPYQSARQLSSTLAQNSRLFPSAAINSTGVGSLFINGHRDSGLPAVTVPIRPTLHARDHFNFPIIPQNRHKSRKNYWRGQKKSGVTRDGLTD